MVDKSYSEMTWKELLNTARSFQKGDMRRTQVEAEIELRVFTKSMEAATAQIRSAFFQGIMVLLTFLIVVATFAAPFIAERVRC